MTAIKFCANALKSLCEMLKVSILSYEKFIRNVSEIRCKLNPFDPFVPNKMINKQCALLLQGDSNNTLYADPKVNSKFAEWAELTCRSGKLGYAIFRRSKKHDCLGAIMD